MTIRVAHFFFLAILAGCSGISKVDCLSKDWYDYAKSQTGHTPKDFKQLSTEAQQICEGHQIRPNLESLRSGYIEGINEYCTGKNIWEKGLEGRDIDLMFCPSGNRGKLQRVYNAAKFKYEISEFEKVAHKTQVGIEKLRDEERILQSRLRELAQANTAQDELDSMNKAIAEKRSEILRLENELASLRLKIGQMQRRAKSFNQVI